MEQIGKIAPALLDRVTASTLHSTGNLPSITQRRLTDLELSEAREIANSPLPALPPCDEPYLNKCLRTLGAALPKQSSDEVSGKLMLSAYRRKLGHLPNAAMRFVTDIALEECQWFPSIKQCLEIAARWERNDEDVQARRRAQAAVGVEMQARMEEIMTALDRGEATQAQVDAMPERWQSIAETRGLLRRLPEGGFVVRAAVIATEEVE